MVSDSADVTSSGRSFQVYRPVTGKARLPTVDSLLPGRHYIDRRLARSATRVKGPRYPGASLAVGPFLLPVSTLWDFCRPICVIQSVHQF